jgi:membrane protein YqaA with SNARE-associated domain
MTTTPPNPDPPPGSRRQVADPDQTPDDRPDEDDSILDEIKELPLELAGVADAVRSDIEGSWIARKSVRAYFWLMDRAPTSTRGRLTLAAVIFVVALAPSLALLYVSVAAGSEATQEWFGRLGYPGIFLANFVGQATLFIPVPGITAAGQALIVSSSSILSPFWVGVVGGLGMAFGEITAYVAGMATAVVAQEEEIKPPARLQKIIARITRAVNWLMDHYGMPTLYVLSAIPNPFFEVAGWTAGATRFPFWKFMLSVGTGKVTRGLLLAYVGERFFIEPFERLLGI